MKPRTRGDQRGSVLLVALAALTLISIFAVALASVIRLERRAAANQLDEARALLAAEAGIHRALHALTMTELAEPVTSFHAPWIYRSQDGASWGIGVPLGQARNPSFAAGATPGGMAYSGIVSGTYGQDHYVLKVVDLASRLCLNGAQESLAESLNVLGRAIAEFDRRRLSPGDELYDPGYRALCDELAGSGYPGTDYLGAPIDPVRGRGAEIVALRDRLGGAFTTIEQLRALLDERELAVLREYVSVHGYRDPLRELRAPVNVNSAAWPVLVACFEGLQARGGTAIDATLARALATAIDFERRSPQGAPFECWEDLEAYLVEGREPVYGSDPEAASSGDRWRGLLPPSGGGGVDWAELIHGLVRANGDPERILDDRNPDAPLRRTFQADELEYTTTELCFFPYGLFEITSLGRVLTADDAVVAQVQVRTISRVYGFLRLTSQKDFEYSRLEPDDRFEVESWPHPTFALAGPKRFRMASTVIEGPGGSTLHKRRWIRIAVASSDAGYIQSVNAPPGVPALSNADQAHVHVFRFAGDMRGEIYRPGSGQDADVYDEPVPDGLADSVRAYALGVGVAPADLGLTEGEGSPTISEAAFDAYFNPDGVLIDCERSVDLQYPAAPETSPEDRILGGSATVRLWFKIGEGASANERAGWTPLLEAYTPVDATYAGLDPATDWVKTQVHARLEERGDDGYVLRIRSRRWSSGAPAVPPLPTLPPELAPDLPMVVQEVTFPLAVGQAHEWHHLYLPMHANAHHPFVDGLPGEVAPSAGGWPLPAWEAPLLGTVAPGGYLEGTGGPFAEATIDDLVTTTWAAGDAALRDLERALQGEPVTSYVMPTRFPRVGPDLMGRFSGVFPPVPGEKHTKIGMPVWNESVPRRWSGLEYHPSDFLTQLTWAFEDDPPRARISPRALPAPDPARLADPFVRYWHLRYLHERRVWLELRVAHYEHLLELAQDPAASDAASAATFERYRARFEARAAAVEAEEERIVAQYGEARRDPVELDPPEHSVAFQLDFIFVNQLEEGLPPENIGLAVGDIVLPFQDRPHILERHVE